MEGQIEHTGIVVAVNGRAVQVKIEQLSACATCNAKMLCSASESVEKLIDAQMTEPVEMNDHVVVYGEQKLGWWAVTLAFVIPVVLVIFGMYGFSHWLGGEAWGTLGLVLLIPYYIILHACDPKFKREFVFYARKAPQGEAE